MPTTQPVGVEDQFAQRIDDSLDRMAEPIAKRLGPAPGAASYSPHDVDDLWNTKDESVDQQALYDALQQGITPEGAQAVALFRMSPALAQDAIGKPLDPSKAAMYTKLAEYPGRYVLTAGHSPDADKQVAYVDMMHKKQAKKMAAPPDAMQPMSAPPTESGSY